MIRRPAAKGAAKARAKAAPKAKGAPKAKAAAKAAVRGILRRPAAAQGRRPRNQLSPEEREKRFQEGKEVEAHQLRSEVFTKGLWLVAAKANYLGQEIGIAGKVLKEEIEGGERELYLEITGTNGEEALKHASALSPPIFRWHLCGPHCDQRRSNPDLCHVETIQRVQEGQPKTWEENLMIERPMEALRADHEEWKKKEKEKGDTKKKESSTSEESRKKKKKKKKKKKEKEKKRKHEEEDPPERREKKKKRPKEDSEDTVEERLPRGGAKEHAQKTQLALFSGTGMDPRPKVRRRIRKKTSKALKNTKEVSTSSDSGSGSSSSEDVAENILVDKSKIHRISQLSPGLLASTTIDEMKPHLSQAVGNIWGPDDKGLPPLLTQYQRSFMVGKLSGGVAREFHTLCHLGDLLCLGKAAQAMDTIVQRMKSIELTARGNPWQSSQLLELIPSQDPQLSSRQEHQQAKKEYKADQDVRGPYNPGGSKGDGKNKTKTKDKGKGGGKNKGKDGQDAKKGQW